MCLITFYSTLLAICVYIFFANPIGNYKFYLSLGLATFFIVANFLQFIEVQSDKVRHKINGKKKRQYDYNGHIIKFALTTLICAVALIFLALFFVRQN